MQPFTLRAVLEGYIFVLFSSCGEAHFCGMMVLLSERWLLSLCFHSLPLYSLPDLQSGLCILLWLCATFLKPPHKIVCKITLTLLAVQELWSPIYKLCIWMIDLIDFFSSAFCQNDHKVPDFFPNLQVHYCTNNILLVVLQAAILFSSLFLMVTSGFLQEKYTNVLGHQGNVSYLSSMPVYLGTRRSEFGYAS